VRHDLVGLFLMIVFVLCQDDAPRPGQPGQAPRPPVAGAPART